MISHKCCDEQMSQIYNAQKSETVGWYCAHCDTFISVNSECERKFKLTYEAKREAHKHERA